MNNFYMNRQLLPWERGRRYVNYYHENMVNAKSAIAIRTSTAIVDAKSGIFWPTSIATKPILANGPLTYNRTWIQFLLNMFHFKLPRTFNTTQPILANGPLGQHSIQPNQYWQMDLLANIQYHITNIGKWTSWPTFNTTQPILANGHLFQHSISPNQYWQMDLLANINYLQHCDINSDSCLQERD